MALLPDLKSEDLPGKPYINSPGKVFQYRWGVVIVDEDLAAGLTAYRRREDGTLVPFFDTTGASWQELKDALAAALKEHQLS